MKKIFLLLMLLSITLVVLPLVSFAGDIRTLPQSIVLSQPTTDKVELLDLRFVYGIRPYAEIRYNVLDSTGNVRASHTVKIQNAVDNDDTPENEATTDFTDFVAGYITTIVNRSDLKVWAHINANYTLQ